MNTDDWLKDDKLYSGNIEISRMLYKNLKKIEALYVRIDNELTEFMGFSDDYLRSDKWLMKHNKKNLINTIHRQRDVIRKVIEELDADKKEQYLSILQRIIDGDKDIT